jgi:preprotein translocase subunit SecB
MADQEPVFQIQRVYLKEASLEQPNSPAILLEQEQPSVDIQLGVEATPVAEGVFEVCVTATVQTKIKEKTVFLVEAKQAGIFEIRNLPPEQLGQIMGIACPQIDSTRWLSARAPVGNQLPGHVRAATSRSCRCASRHTDPVI